MVAPEQEEVLGVFDLVRQQKADGLQGLLPSVHIVAQEQVVGLRREAAILKEPQQVCVLSVDITWEREETQRRIEQRTAGYKEDTNNLKESEQKGGKLTTDFERSLELQKDGLTEEDLPGFDAEASHLSLRHLDNLPWTTSSHWWRERKKG